MPSHNGSRFSSPLLKLGAENIPTVTVLNKIDRMPSKDLPAETRLFFQDAISISAKKGQGIPDLLKTIELKLYKEMVPIEVELPYNQGNLISIFHDQGLVTKIEHGRGKVHLEGSIPGRLLTQYQPFFTPVNTPEEDQQDGQP